MDCILLCIQQLCEFGPLTHLQGGDKIDVVVFLTRLLYVVICYTF
jgi:hypothetical protein